jgi:cytidine deaminase
VTKESVTARRVASRNVDPATMKMIAAARAARTRAYAPYSGFRVGAAILTRRGGIHVGCNIENASYGAAMCAERCAIAAMMASGDTAPIACAVVTVGPLPVAPCGICRQVLAEFARDMRLVLVAEDERGRVIAQKGARLSVLLPQAFRLRGFGR